MVQPRMDIDPLTGQPIAMSTMNSAQRQQQLLTNGAALASPMDNTQINAATPTPSASPGADGLGAMTGWAAQQGFTPEMLKTIYSNPWYTLPHIFNGVSTASPGYQALRDIGADPLALFLMTEGAGKTIPEGGQGQGDYANFLQRLYSGLGTPNGKALDARELLGNIFSQNVGEDANTALGLTLNAGDMGQQVRTLFNMLRDVASSSMNPLAGAGYQAAIARAGDRYGSEMLTSGTGTPQDMHLLDWIKQNMPGLAVT